MLYIVFEDTTARNRDQILDVIARRRHQRWYIVCIAGCRFTVNIFSVCEKGHKFVFLDAPYVPCNIEFFSLRLKFLHYELMLHFASHMLLYFALRLILRHKLNLASLRTSPTNNKSEIVLCIHQYLKVIGK